MGSTAVQRERPQCTTPRIIRYSLAAFVSLVVVGTTVAGGSSDAGLAVETPTRNESPSASPLFTGSPSTSAPSFADNLAATQDQAQER